jgi:hypothetical protein
MVELVDQLTPSTKYLTNAVEPAFLARTTSSHSSQESPPGASTARRSPAKTKLWADGMCSQSLWYCGMRSATGKQLGVVAWWSPFIRIIADVALTSNIP